MIDSSPAALIALLRCARRPWSVYTPLLADGHDPLVLLERELAEDDHGQTSFMAPNADERIARATAELRSWERRGIRTVTLLDATYPPNLHAVHDRPPLLFVSGTLADGDSRSVAVIGSRRASFAGLSRAHAVSEHLVTHGYTVISGLATGVDTAAHAATLAAGGRTVAVIGTGLDHSYPAENARLQHRIAEDGAVVSQFWPDTPPSRSTFPMRNAVMSGLSLATVVIEAAPTSGARVQVRRALAHGRPVFFARALLAQDWARQLAARPGVHAYDEPEEITAAVERLTAVDMLVA